MGDSPAKEGQDRSDETAKLELPSLSLRRRKKKSARPARQPATAPDPAPESAPEPARVPSVDRAADRAEPAPAAEPAVPPEPAAAAEPAVHPEPAVAAEPATVSAPAAGPEPAEAPVAVEQPDEGSERPEGDTSATEDGEPRRRWRRPQLPALNPWVAVPVTGLVVGLAGTLLTYVSLQGCEAVRGTETCGGPGLFVLAIILVLMALLGGVLLALWKVSANARATSVLAVGVLCVIVMVTLLEELFSAWMFIVVPLLSVLCYLLAHWVTTRYVELPERGPEHDVR